MLYKFSFAFAFFFLLDSSIVSSKIESYSMIYIKELLEYFTSWEYILDLF